MLTKRLIVLSGDGDKGTLKLTDDNGLVTATLVTYALYKTGLKLYVLSGGSFTGYELIDSAPYTVTLSPTVNVATAHFAVMDGTRCLMYGTANSERLRGEIFSEWVQSEKNNENNTDAVTPSATDEVLSNGQAHGEKLPLPKDIQNEQELSPSTEYDDSAIATENYYAVQPQPLFEPSEVIQSEQAADVTPNVDTAVTVPPLTDTPIIEGRARTFYERHSEQIEKLFASGERFTHLEKLLPHTKWVKVKYSENKHYLVGLIGIKPDYICYGLEGVYSSAPPTGTAGYAQWLPLDVLTPHGQGYWLLYQSADDGQTVRFPAQ